MRLRNSSLSNQYTPRNGKVNMQTTRDETRQPLLGQECFSPKATKEDIFYCFRLLLGRNPNPEEWPGHSARAGEPLETIVKNYLNSRGFADRALLTRSESDELRIARLDGFSLWVPVNDLDVGRHVLFDQYEPWVTAFLREQLRPGMSFLDVGANIGFFTMMAASIIGPQGKVIAVEPNENNVKLIEASRRANNFKNITIAQCAAGRETGLLALHSSQTNGTTSPLPEQVENIIAAQCVAQFRIDDIVPKSFSIDFIKIDVEGAEYNALLGANDLLARCKPIIVSEFGPQSLPAISSISGEGFLRWLLDNGYRLGVLQPDCLGPTLTEDTSTIMREFHRRGHDHIDIVAMP